MNDISPTTGQAPAPLATGSGTGFTPGHTVLPGVKEAEASQNQNQSSESQGEKGNNTLSEKDFEVFWKKVEEGEDGKGDNNPDPNASNPAPSQSNQSNVNPMEALAAHVGKMDFGTPDLTAEQQVLVQQGDMSPVIEVSQQMAQKAVINTLQMVGPMLDKMKTELTATIDSQAKSIVADKFDKQAKESALLDRIESARDPAIRPIAEAAFVQALTKTNGDQEKALAMTEQFLDAAANKMGSKVDLESAPGVGNNNNDSNADDWMTWVNKT